MEVTEKKKNVYREKRRRMCNVNNNINHYTQPKEIVLEFKIDFFQINKKIKRVEQSIIVYYIYYAYVILDSRLLFLYI